jgi:hypothetical protein
MDDINVIGILEVTFKHPTQGLSTKNFTASLYSKVNSTHWTIITCASNFTRYSRDTKKDFDAHSAKFFLQKGNPGNKDIEGERECLAEFKVVQFNCYGEY